MSRLICTRCKQSTFAIAGETTHLCADIAKRLKRREAQVDAVLREFAAFGIEQAGSRLIAEAIVVRLAGMGVADD